MTAFLPRALLLFCAIVTSLVSAQETLLLKMGYNPDSAYVVSETSDILMTLNAPQDATRIPPEDDAESPLNIRQKGETTTRVISGSLESDGSYRVIMSLESGTSAVSINEGFWREQPVAADVLGDAAVEMRVLHDGQIELLSLGGQPVPVELESLIDSLHQQMLGTGLDDVTIALGQTVPVRMPVELPLGDLGNMDVELLMYFTLEAFEGGLGLFDIDMDMTMTMEIEGTQLVMKATGTGAMTYDPVEAYSPMTEMDITMQVTAPDDSAEQRLSMSMHSLIRISPDLLAAK